MLASVIVLTKDEAANVGDVLAALARQTCRAHEVLVVDAGSTDGTVEAVRQAAVEDPRVRLIEGPRDLGFGAARNLGLAEARAERVAFVSADAVPADDWLEALLRATEDADAAFGRQVHAPSRANAATIARGLRYHVFERHPPFAPEVYASNVNAMWRRSLLEAHPFDEALPASEDAELTRRVRGLGYRVVYAPDALVRHKDVATASAEWRKVRREGRANGALARDGRVDGSLLVWGGAVAGAATAGLVAPGLASVAVAAAFLWAPTLRRLVVLRPRRYAAAPLAAGVLVAPVFDLGYLSGYLQGVVRA